jgi:hypothetical protein
MEMQCVFDVIEAVLFRVREILNTEPTKNNTNERVWESNMQHGTAYRNTQLRYL